MRSTHAFILALSLSAAPLAGCVVITHDPANLDISVTFDGQATCPSNVATIQITYNDDLLSDFDCGDDLVVNLALGTYQVQIEALDSVNNVLYTATQNVVLLPGGTSVTIDLTSTAPAGLMADFLFGGPLTSTPTSADYMGCVEAGVESVLVVVDSGASLVADCNDATSGQDAALVPISVGNHTLTWSAFSGANATGTLLYDAPATSVAIPSSDRLEVAFDMPAAGGLTGGLSVAWTFQGSTGCPSNVATVKYDVLDPTGKSVLGDVPTTANCSAGSLVLPSLVPGVYNLTNIEGLESDGTTIAYTGPSTLRLYAPAGHEAAFTVTLTSGS